MNTQTIDTTIPSLDRLKSQAKRLRKELSLSGTDISHSKSLEMLAIQFGLKDWNTLHALSENQPIVAPYSVGQRVQGQYLKQDFQGRISSVQELSHSNPYRVTFAFDEPVDVVSFESFSSMRQRVTTELNRDGTSPAKLSDGTPQMVLS